MPEFVHLHVHSQYSMLEGAIRMKELCGRVKEMGMPAVALTDHGNMHGAIDFYKKAKDAGIQAILGCEMGFGHAFPGDKPDKHGRFRSYHLPLLASSEEGYRNLIALVSHAWLDAGEGLSAQSNLDRLSKHAKGLVVLTGCLGGLVPQALLQQSPDLARQILGQLKEMLEPGHLFVELQDHGLVEQPIVNRILVEMAKEMELPVVATNDAHYLRRDDATGQRALTCIASGSTLEEAQSTGHTSEEMFLKSPDEMAEVFSGLPEALSNTMRVAEMCKLKLKLGEPTLPKFRDGSGHVVNEINDFFAGLCREGLDKRFATFKRQNKTVDEKKYRDRLELEIGVIQQMKFPGYFLIVQDFINWGKSNGVPVGPGRGSGAGSIVAYALGITDIDPIPYDLLFERFLNPERVSMPDFDVDFCMLKRERVIAYVRDKYGHDSVGQIATFQILKAKSCVRDVGRVLGMSYQDVDAIAKLVPDPVQGKTVPLKEALTQEPRLKAMYDEQESTRAVIDLAMKVENLNRHAGMHAAGIVISEGPLWDTVPIFKGSGGEIVTQYAKDEVEAAGLVKFDFLGLTTLTVLDFAIEMIRRRPDEIARVAKGGHPFLIEDIPMDGKDPNPANAKLARETFELLQSGETTGVFQLESSGMQKLFKDLRPDCFEDIVAAVALYRPGPLGTGMVEDFVNRKIGKAKVAYPHDDLKDILKDTYGVIVYQEQVMMIARKMGGYSLGGADLLRRAMGKKKKEEMEKHKGIFVEGAKKLGYDEAKAGEIFDLLEYFAGYGFNKSHSAAYALITYQTAYLKRHFPVEFMAATLCSDLGKIEKLVGTINEARAMGIEVMVPDVNESDRLFTVIYEPKPVALRKKPVNRIELDPYRPRIRVGLGGIKGVGDSAIESVLEARLKGPFQDLFDFTTRIDPRRVNKGVVEALVNSGAFDKTLEKTGATRAQAFAAIESALERGKGAAKERSSGQMGLFSIAETLKPSAGYPAVEPWDLLTRIKNERDALGLYLTGHPLDRYAAEAARQATVLSAQLQERENGEEVTLAGVIEGYREKVPKSGGRMAFFFIEDRSGRVEAIVRPKTYDSLADKMKEGEAVLVTGKVKVEFKRDDEGNVDEEVPEAQLTRSLSVETVTPLGDALRARTRGVTLRLSAANLLQVEVARRRLEDLKKALVAHPGKCPVNAVLKIPDAGEVVVALPRMRVDPSEEFLAKIERIFGEKVAELRS
ncbi:MAG: DNA polymerase III subunit alpha [Polyangiales bacterium]